MDPEHDVRAAAAERAGALGAGDRERLAALLHPLFHWTSHRGEVFDRSSYLDANTGGGATTWHSQQLEDVAVKIVGDTAVLRCTAVDDVTTPAGRAVFRMPVTQTWVRTDGHWQCLAGHAGPHLSP